MLIRFDTFFLSAANQHLTNIHLSSTVLYHALLKHCYSGCHLYEMCHYKCFSDTETGEAIDGNKFDTVKELCEQDELLCEKAINYVIDTKDPNFIAEFIKRTGFVTGYTLVALYRKPRATSMDMVDKIGPSLEDWDRMTSQSNPMPSPDEVIAILNKIPITEGQEDAVMIDTQWLFINKQTEYFYPLPDALEGKGFLSKFLKFDAIQTAFLYGVQHKDETWTESLYSHPFIPSTIHAKGLYPSEGFSAQDSTFK